MDAEPVEDADSDSELEEESVAVPVATGETEVIAVTERTADVEVEWEAELDKERSPVCVADALSDTRPEAVAGAFRVLVVVEDGEMVNTVQDAVAESVVALEAVGTAETVLAVDKEALEETDAEGEDDTLEVRVPTPEPDTVDVEDTVPEFDCGPVLLGVDDPEGEPVEDIVFAAEVEGEDEFEETLEKVGAPVKVASDDFEAVEVADAAVLPLEVVDAEPLTVSVKEGEAEEDTELESVLESEDDPVTE